MPAATLFDRFALKSLDLKTRIVMAPMTRSFSPDGVPPPAAAAYYARRAAADVGLIITEGTVVDRPAAANDLSVPKFHGDQPLSAWKRVLDAVHGAGGMIAPQLWHVGSAAPSKRDWTPLPGVESPSGLVRPGEPHGEPMTEDAIGEVIDAFVRAAVAAKDLGFDAIQLHGAHGFIFDQFFWPELNRRTDRWGGSTIAARSRFAAETVRAIRAAVGEAMVIMFRISQFKVQDYDARIAHSPDELEAWLGGLSEAGVDLFDCSQRRFWDPEFEGSDLNLAGWAKKLTGRPSMTVGSVGLTAQFAQASGDGAETLAALMRRYERGEFDLVGVGRALLSDADWASKVRLGQYGELRDFDPAALLSLS